jgi:hypothetical protein
MSEEGREVVRVEGGDPDDDEDQQDRQLEDDHHGVRPDALANTEGDHTRHRGDQEDRRKVELATFARRRRDGLRETDAKHRVEQLLQVAAPADGDGRQREAVLEDQVPADDPGSELAKRRVAVGVGAPCHRNPGSELGVGER